MNKPKKIEVSSNLVLVSWLSTGIIGPISISYALLSILALVYRSKCDVGSADDFNGSDFFISLVYRVYIQSKDCNNVDGWEDLTQPDTVFVMSILTLCASVLCALAATILITIMLSEEKQYLYICVYTYAAVCFASLVVDITFATHFGIDHSFLSEQMDISSPELAINYYSLDLGALLLMMVCLKGYVAHVINMVLLGLMITYTVEYQRQLLKEQHPIHKLGALNAYDQPRRQDPWQTQMYYRGPQSNPTFVDDASSPPRSPRRELTAHDYTRSESWQTASLPRDTVGSRPFSYLEESKRTPRAPSRDPRELRDTRDARDRDWPPPVPAPDYSPHSPRRLKSALKPSYM